jgi:hypothetical protein
MNTSAPSDLPDSRPICDSPRKADSTQLKVDSPLQKEHAKPAGVLAGVTKAFATRGVILYNALLKGSIKGSLKATTKGALKYYTRSPVKFFRPVKIDHWWVVRSKLDGKASALQYSKVVRKEGAPFVFKHMLPLLLVNSLSGILLFQTYESTRHVLKNHSTAAPFIAGFAGGCVQTLISTPIENLASLLSPHNVAKDNQGLIRHVFSTMSSIKSEGQKGYKVLYRGASYNCVKDAFGFSAFFGTFEYIKRLGIIQSRWDSPYARGCNNLIAGASAGLAFQLLTFPFEVMRPMLFPETRGAMVWDSLTEEYLETDKHVGVGRHHHAQTKHWLFRIPSLIRTHGIVYFYQGVSAQAVKAAPVSAVALLVYEWAKQNVWDEND